MKLPARKKTNFDDTLFVRLSREIAMNIFEIEDVLLRHDISRNDWETIQSHPRFIALLQNSIEEWESALNTSQRVKVKASSMIELWLGHANELLHSNEDVNKKTELAKFIARLAEIPNTQTQAATSGERLSVIINLGAEKLTIEKDITPQVINYEPAD